MLRSIKRAAKSRNYKVVDVEETIAQTQDESIEYWGRIVREQEANGLSIKQFCGDRKIQQTQFYKWGKQLKASAAAAAFVWPTP